MKIVNQLLDSCSSYDFVIFDCDGVIFDSNPLKIEAFQNTLQKLDISSEIIYKFIQYHKDKGGVSRYVKFRYLIEEILNRPFDNFLYNDLLSTYSKECVKLYISVNFTLGADEFIRKLHEKSKPVYIASGSDETELRKVFSLRGIDYLFKSILGSPKNKMECVQKIISWENNNNGIFFGDAISDFNAANSFNLDFIGIIGYSDAKDALMSLAKEKNFSIKQNFAN